MKWIKPSEINGTLTAPPSKSLMIRACAAALLTKGESVIKNPSFCDDARSALDIIQALGARVNEKKAEVKIKGGKHTRNTVLDCGESGLCMRMFAPIAALDRKKFTLTGSGTLLTRPMDMLEEPLRQLGGFCQTRSGHPPVQIKGPIRGGRIILDGSTSSQVLTGLFLALPLCPLDSEIDAQNLRSRPYAALTHSVLQHFGITISEQNDYGHVSIKGNQLYRPAIYTVEGDWSSAAFMLVAGAVNGQVTLTRLSEKSPQADKKVLEAFISCGADITVSADAVSVRRNQLKAFDFDATECPDLFPPLTVLASACRGRSRIAGVQRLRHKESDRAHTLQTELTKIGAQISFLEDTMEIEGVPMEGGAIDSHGDHRIAMAGAVAGLHTRNGVGIRKWQAVSKSYPDFFDDLKTIQGGAR